MLRNLFRTSNQDGYRTKVFRCGSNLNAAILILPVIVFFLVRRISDSDTWFHMAVGKLILATRSLPATDQLSLLNLGQPIHAYLWLFQIIAAAGYPLAGFWWLHFLQIAVLGLAFYFVFRSTRAWTTSWTAWLLLLAAVIASSERFALRPEIISIMMIALFYLRLQQGRYHTPADLAIFFILQVIWTNCHGIFVIGPVLVGCYFAEALTKGITGKGYMEVKSSGILTATTAVACYVTPFGLDNVRYAWRLLTESNPMSLKLSNSTYEMGAALGEVSRTLLPFWLYLFLIIAFATSCLAVVLYQRKHTPIARTLIGLSMLAASLTGMKNMPVFAIVAVPLLAENLSLLGNTKIRAMCHIIVAAAMTMAVFIWSPRPAFYHLTTWVPYRFGLGLSGDYVPLGLPEFLHAISFSGPIFNSMEQGGYYEYHGYPARISFYDARLQDYNPHHLVSSYNAVVNASLRPADWNELERRFAFRGILLGNLPDSKETAGLLPLISSDPAWRLVYLDYAASFWMRSDSNNVPPALGQPTLDNLVYNCINSAQAENINFFLEKTGLFPELRFKLLENAAKQWENAEILISLGLMEMQSGDYMSAEKHFLRVLERKPDSRLTLTTIAQLALYRNDRAAAEKYIRKALHKYPHDSELMENLNLIVKNK